MALKIIAVLNLLTFASTLPNSDVNINININAGNAGSAGSALPKVVIDTDAAVDDAMAILMILAAHKRGELEVVAITTVNGMTGVGNFTNNVLRLLQTANLMHIPVYSGSWTPLIRPWSWELMNESRPYNGYNGFGDVPLKPEHVRGHPQEQPAAIALVEIAKQYEGSLILLCIGPLSNVAIAMRMDSQFTERLQRFYIMGGNSTEYEDVPEQEPWNPNDETLQPNISLCWNTTDFNFYVDAEAARLVLKNTKTKIHLVPHNTCIENQIPHDYRESLGCLRTPEACLINQIQAGDPALKGNWTTYDQLAAAWVIDDIRNKEKETAITSEHLVTTTTTCYGLVELQDECRGRMVINNTKPYPPNLIIMEKINMGLYKNYLKTAFGGKLEEDLPECSNQFCAVKMGKIYP